MPHPTRFHGPDLRSCARIDARAWAFLLLLLGLLPLATRLSAQAIEGAIAFEASTLDNGLEVILAPDPAATTVTVNLWYGVGSRNERPGRSGFAHLFEHMMFQGSENIAMGEHFKFVERAGGNLNASTTEDRTNYYETLPPDRLNLALWMEADRMRSLQITAETLQREIEVVKEERRLRIDNSPYGTTLLQAAFYGMYDAGGCFPYAHSVIGSMEDLDAAELADVQEFFDLYYAPNNATLVIVGDFDRETAMGLVREYFGSIPRGAEPPEVSCPDPFRGLPRTERITDPNAQLPAVFVSYAGVSRDHPDAPALSVLADILGGGQSSRLNLSLVRQAQVAVQAVSTASHRKGPGLIQFIAIANPTATPERVLELLDAELAAIGDQGVSDAEVGRARNRVRASTVLSRQTTMGRAEALQTARHFYGTAEAANTLLAEIEAVDAADVQRVARTYLDPSRRGVFFTLPATAQGADR